MLTVESSRSQTFIGNHFTNLWTLKATPEMRQLIMASYRSPKIHYYCGSCLTSKATEEPICKLIVVSSPESQEKNINELEELSADAVGEALMKAVSSLVVGSVLRAIDTDCSSNLKPVPMYLANVRMSPEI